MSSKDIPIRKKQIKDLLKGMTWEERLKVLEPLAEHCRKMRRKEVYRGEQKIGIDEYQP